MFQGLTGAPGFTGHEGFPVSLFLHVLTNTKGQYPNDALQNE